jgi:hypothetical protein
MVNYAAAADDVQTRPSPERFGGTVSVFGWEIAVNGVTAVREIYIRLGRNDELKNWSVEINGQFHEHVMDEGLTDLLEGALIVAAKSLILAQGHPGNPELAEATAPAS